MSDTPSESDGNVEGKPDRLAGWVIGIYLVVHIVLLSVFGFLAWVAPASSLELLGLSMPEQRFHTCQSVILAACAAGLGGAVFMAREFYLQSHTGARVQRGRQVT